MIQRTDNGKQARRYFIEAEQALTQLTQNKRMESFLKPEATKGQLLQNIQSIGGDQQSFAQIDFKARKVFLNGKPVPDEPLN